MYFYVCGWHLHVFVQSVQSTDWPLLPCLFMVYFMSFHFIQLTVTLFLLYNLLSAFVIEPISQPHKYFLGYKKMAVKVSVFVRLICEPDGGRAGHGSQRIAQPQVAGLCQLKSFIWPNPCNMTTECNKPDSCLSIRLEKTSWKSWQSICPWPVANKPTSYRRSIQRPRYRKNPFQNLPNNLPNKTYVWFSGSNFLYICALNVERRDQRKIPTQILRHWISQRVRKVALIQKNKNIARSQNSAQSTSHWLSRCQVALTKRLFKVVSEVEFCQTLSFWVLSEFEFLNCVAIWVFEFCCYLSFWV